MNMTIKTLKKYKALLEVGLSDREIAAVHRERTRTAKNRGDNPARYSKCPKCQHMHLNETGSALSHCHCGYCIHTDQTGIGGVITCDHCGKKNPPFVELAPEHFETFEAPLPEPKK